MKIRSLNEENSLYHDSLDLLGITDTSNFPFTQFYRSANHWYRKGDTWAWQATGTWELDDSNKTTLPIATADLVDEQQDYELPSAARKIDRVEVKDSDGDYYPLGPFDKSMVKGEAMSEFYETPGLPKYYDLVGRSVLLYPKPDSDDVTTSSGLKMYVTRDIEEFSITDTSVEPGFDNHFHRIISLGAAYDWCIANEMEERKKELRTEITLLKKEMQEFYATRHREMPTRIIPKDSDNI